MIEVLKASEIPAGARILNGQGRALTGTEVALGLAALVEQEVSQAAREILEQRLLLEWWPSMHLTFPNVKLEWCACEGGIWLRALLDRNHIWEFRFNDEAADIRDLKQLGPFRSPDEMRDALGLPRIAQFRTPEGKTFTAELPRAHTTGRQMTREQALQELAAVQQAPLANPMEDMELVRKEVGEAVERMQQREEQPETELLAEPPQVEPSPEVIEAPKAAPKRVALKKAVGVKKR